MELNYKLLYKISFSELNNETRSNGFIICEITLEEEINLKNGIGLIDLLCQRQITLAQLIHLLKQNYNYTILNASGNYTKKIEINNIERL